MGWGDKGDLKVIFIMVYKYNIAYKIERLIPQQATQFQESFTSVDIFMSNPT